MNGKTPNGNVVIISYKMYDKLRNKYDNLEMSYGLLEEDYDNVLELCLEFQDQLIEHGILPNRVIEVNDIEVIEEYEDDEDLPDD